MEQGRLIPSVAIATAAATTTTTSLAIEKIMVIVLPT